MSMTAESRGRPRRVRAKRRNTRGPFHRYAGKDKAFAEHKHEKARGGPDLFGRTRGGQPRCDGGGAAEEEPRPLFSLPNVALTPHSAGPTWDDWTKAYRNGFDNIQRVEAGRAPFWVVPELKSLVQ